MALIEFQNNQAPYLNADNLNNNFNVLDSAYCVATISASQNISSQTTVALSTVYGSKGNFTISNNGIVIGAGINRVRISASVFVQSWPGGDNYLWALIKKNGTQVASSINGAGSGFLSASVPNTIIEVEENDVITLVADSPGGGTLRSGASQTWLCVEKVS